MEEIRYTEKEHKIQHNEDINEHIFLDYRSCQCGACTLPTHSYIHTYHIVQYVLSVVPTLYPFGTGIA